VTGAQGPHRTLQDLLRAARAQPSAVSYASTGVGSAPHLFGALIGLRAGAEMVHVPYRGGAPAVLDVVAGRADFLVVSLGDVSQQLRGGELRLLALGDERRLPGIPEAPTLGSAMPGLEAYSWFALCGPRGITAEGRGRWERVVQSAVADPAFRARVEQMGLVTLYEDGPAVERRIEADRRKWGEVVRAANIRAQ
jgi:tripartite-type tricarboxylate transporter receptor subunit TctC